MITPLSLLKTAVSENTVNDRTELVVRACKQITNILPFANKAQALLEEPELIKYLMLSAPLNPRSVAKFFIIQWIVSSIIDRFKSDNQFLKILWSAFVAISFLNERESEENRKSVHGLKLFQIGVKKALNVLHVKKLEEKTLDNQSWNNQNFCEEINTNKNVIKTSCLKHLKRFSEMYFKNLKDFMAFEPDFGGLLKKFIMLTENQDVIIKTVKIIENLRKEGRIKLDSEIEELLVNKKSVLCVESEKENIPPLPRVLTRANTLNVETANRNSMTRFDAQTELNMSYEWKKKSTANVKKWNSVIMDVLHPKFNERDSLLREMAELQKIEQWLAESEIDLPPQINNKANIEEYFSNATHFEKILSFIFEPDSHSLASSWKQNFSMVMQSETVRSSGASAPLGFNSKLLNQKDSELYILRSFKTMQALTDEKNFKIIFERNKGNVEVFFHHVYHTWSIKGDNFCNYNHVGMLIETLIRRNPELCIGFILHYNLLYKFIQNIESPFVQRLLLTLFKSSEHAKDMNLEAYKKLLRYCESSSFFPDVTKAILYGWDAFESNKFNLNYKPPGVEELVSIALEGSACQSEIVEAYQLPYEPKRSMLPEELNDFQIDIDYLQPVLQNKSQTTQQPISKLQPASVKRIRQKRYMKYPSLTEQTLSTRDDSTSEELRTQENVRPTINSLDFSEDSKKSSHREESLLSSIPKSKTGFQTTGRKSDQNAILVVSQKSDKFSGRKSTFLTEDKKNVLKAIVNTTGGPTLKNELLVSGKTKSGPTKMLNFGSEKGSEAKQQQSFKRNIEIKREGIIKKRGRYTHNDQENIVRNSVELSGRAAGPAVKFLDTSHILKPQKPSKPDSRPIQRIPHQEFDMEVLDQEKMKELDKLYPTAMQASSPIELEAAKEEFRAKHLKENDHFSIAVCEFLEGLFRKASCKAFDIEGIERTLENDLGVNTINKKDEQKLKNIYELKRNIGMPDFDFSLFWQSVFTSDCALFENLLKNYLFKIKIHHLEEVNSGYMSGTLINLILEECAKGNPNFESQNKQIQIICQKYFKFLCKSIVQSYAWLPKEQLPIYLQDYQVKNPLGSGRLLLVQTLKLIIENDRINGFKLTGEITDTCWHVLTHWFFMDRTNNIFQNIFYSILEISFLNNSETFITNILIKLGFISSLYKTWSEIYQNNMLRKDLHIDSILYHLKKMTYLIDYIVQENEDYKILKRELKKSLSWEIVRGGLLSLKDLTSHYQLSSRVGSNIKNRSLFSPPYDSRYKRHDEAISESILSRSDYGDRMHDEYLFEGFENSTLKALEKELRK